MICNDPQYGGSGLPGLAAVYNGAEMTRVATHESGHAHAGLGDEYFYSDLGYFGPEPTQPNLTTQPVATSSKWGPWVGATVSDGTRVGTFAGGLNVFDRGIFRPVDSDCHMKDHDRGYCPVCREAVIRSLHGRTNMITRTSASASFGLNLGTFTASVDEIVPDASTVVTWTVDGVAVGTTSIAVNGTAMRHTLTRNLGWGAHTVTATVRDNSTMLRIGSDPKSSVTWTFWQN